MSLRHDLVTYWHEPLVVHGDNEYLCRFAEVRADRFEPEELAAAVSVGHRYKGPLEWRAELIPQYAWAVPCDEALDCLARYAPLVEIGCGSGYWCYLLRERGVDIVAYDLSTTHYLDTRLPIARRWTEIGRDGARAARRHQDRTLFLCWPPLNRPMAYRALQFYRGSTAAYIGEWRAATADDAFHDALERGWHQVEDVALPTYWGLNDRLWVYQRR